MKRKLILIVTTTKNLSMLFFMPLVVTVTLGFLLTTLSVDNQTISALLEKQSIPTVSTSKQESAPKLAIIIDDFGQNRKGVLEMINVKKPLTLAVLPFMQFTQEDAKNGHSKGHEIIVHLPMQAQYTDVQSWLGPKPIKLSSNNSEIKNIVLESIEDVPFAVGVNIHMGTKSSEDERIMIAVMESVKSKNLYFIDSKTSTKSICRAVSKKVDLPFMERQVFLEHTSNKSKKFIKDKLLLAGKIALNKGYAIAIGHIGSVGGKVTVESINEMIPELENMGIEFVTVSQLFKK